MEFSRGFKRESLNFSMVIFLKEFECLTRNAPCMIESAVRIAKEQAVSTATRPDTCL
jgi:hypothetical protein